MKFASLLSAVLVFAISAVNAEKEEARLLFLPSPHRIFPPRYIIRADLFSSGTSYEIVLDTKVPNWVTEYPERSNGVIEYNTLHNGYYNALINDNDYKDGTKTFRLDLGKPGIQIHFEGTSVTDEQIKDLEADGRVMDFEDDFSSYSHSRFYRNKGRYSYKNQQPMSPPCTK